MPQAGQPCTPEFVFLLIQTDIEFRVKAGLPALLAEPYFRHPRLQMGSLGIGLSAPIKTRYDMVFYYHFYAC